MDKSRQQEGQPRQAFRVAEWEVDTASGRIRRGEVVVKLEPKVMDLLVCLASRPGEVFTREEIESTVWPGMVVGYDALTSATIKLRKAFGDDSHQPQVIETVSKRGYRLIAAVGEVSGAASSAEVPPDSIGKAPRRFRLTVWVALSVVAGLLASGIGYWTVEKRATSRPDIPVVSPSIPDTPSIVVLPFANLSGDPAQEYFIDGITQDIITDLSRLSKMLVIAANTSFKYKGEQVQPQQIGHDLGVNYVLQGNVRHSGDRVRINAQLVDTRNGYHVWAERYDRRLEEIFDVQDEVTRNIVSSLAVRLTPQEKELLGRKATNNIDAYDFFLQGMKFYQQRTKEANRDAQAAYKQAIKLDPGYARAYGALAVSFATEYRRGWAEAPVEMLDRALNLARKAVALDELLPQAYWALGYVHRLRKEYTKASQVIEKAIAIAPNYADGYGLLALNSNSLGRSEEAIRLITQGMKLNPYFSWDYPYNIGRAYYTLGRYREAIEALQEALERNENAVMARLFLTASYVGQGQQEEAEWEAEQLQVMSPATTITHLSKTLPIQDPVQKNAFLAHLRQAGLPD